MCKQLGIARAAFYKWKHRIIPQQERENQEIAELIKEYDERFSHILGYRRMTDWINHFNQTHFSRKRTHRIMKKLGIHSAIRKKKKKYNTSKPEETAENKLARDFYAAAPNQKWIKCMRLQMKDPCVMRSEIICDSIVMEDHRAGITAKHRQR